LTLSNFEEDNYFLAFMDICGFKNLMKLNRERSLQVLNNFYNIGFSTISNQIYNREDNRKIIEISLFSDSCLLIAHNINSRLNQFKSLLEIIKTINKDFYTKSNELLMSSIVFGKFRFQNRFQDIGTSKNFIFGEGFIQAYQDNERMDPMKEAGLCCINIRNIPQGISDYLKEESILFKKRDHFYYYYFWMASLETPANSLYKQYQNAYRNYFNKYKEIINNSKNID